MTVRAMQRCTSRPAPGGVANQGEDGGLARRTLVGAGRWREASGGAREAHFRLSKIGSAAAGPEVASVAQEVKKWCPGRSRLAGGARALLFQLAQKCGCRRLVFSTQNPATGAIVLHGWHKSAGVGRGHFGAAVALFLGLFGLAPGGALAGLEMARLDRYRVGPFALSFPSPAGRIIGSESGVSGDGRLLDEDAGVAGQQVQDGAHQAGVLVHLLV